MIISLLSLEFHLEGCHSLKEKRQRLGGLKERYGRSANVAVTEQAFHDDLQHALWSFVAVGSAGRVVDATLSDIERNIASNVDAVIVNVHRESL